MTAAKAFLAQVVEQQDGIIKAQSEIIDGLFLLLAQHLPARELGQLPEVGKMEGVARLMKEYEGKGGADGGRD